MRETPDTGAAPFFFYCDMMALSPHERTAHQERITRLFGELMQEKQELPDGFAFRFEGEQYGLLAEFITYERLCCPFLNFHLDVTPYRGPVWLRLTAQGDVKPFLQEEVGHYTASH